MASKKLERELKRGSAELLILALLEERRRHGYEIGQLIDTRSRGTISFHVTSLYPTLYRLEDRGLIEGRWVERVGQRGGLRSRGSAAPRRRADPRLDGGSLPPEPPAAARAGRPTAARLRHAARRHRARRAVCDPAAPPSARVRRPRNRDNGARH